VTGAGSGIGRATASGWRVTARPSAFLAIHLAKWRMRRRKSARAVARLWS
jgi:hypothetical protein